MRFTPAQLTNQLMTIGILTLHLQLPDCQSLKEKRSRLKPVLARLQRDFNASVAEMAEHNRWQSAVIGCALISNDRNRTQKQLQTIINWFDTSPFDVQLVNEQIEIL